MRVVGEGTRLRHRDELAQLITRAQAGDERALTELLTELRRWLIAYYRHRVASADVDDLAQRALVSIAQSLPRIYPDRAMAYVSTVARRLSVHAIRQRRVFEERFCALGVEALPARDDPWQDAVYAGAAQACKISLLRLPAHLRIVMEQLAVGHSLSDVAALLDLHETTVRTRAFRARAMLRRELAHYLDDAGFTGGRRARCG